MKKDEKLGLCLFLMGITLLLYSKEPIYHLIAIFTIMVGGAVFILCGNDNG